MYKSFHYSYKLNCIFPLRFLKYLLQRWKNSVCGKIIKLMINFGFYYPGLYPME